MRDLISIITIFVISLTVMGMSSCNSDNGVEETPLPVETPEIAAGDSWEATATLPEGRTEYAAIGIGEGDREIIAGQNDFALDLFRELSKADKENSLLSPVSLSLNLGMLANGAAGSTLDELFKMTGVEGENGIARLNSLNKTLMEGLAGADKATELSLANSLWIDSGYDVTDDFIKSNCDNYYASIYRRVLCSDPTKEEINRWADKHTKGIINPLLEKNISDDTRIVLINALYFYGTWANPFNSKETYTSKFTCQDGTKVNADLMVYPEIYFDFAENSLFEAFYLPFGNGAYRMTFLLPKKGVNLETAEAGVTSGELSRLEKNIFRQGGELLVPKFTVRAGGYLEETLGKLGYHNIFSPAADFSGINPEGPLWVDDILQKAEIRVDENGAEGAVSTMTGMDNSVGPRFAINRPFIFLISEKSSGAILFVGDVKKL